MRVLALMVCAAMCSAAADAAATPYDGDINPAGHVPTLGHQLYSNPELAGRAAAVDREYVSGMRRHHEGALTMSRAYLAEPGPPHPLMGRLARAIIANQEFEIALLDDVGRRLDASPTAFPLGMVSRQLGWDGFEHSSQFLKYPPPGFLDLATDRTPTTEKEVRFAKGMIIHHQAAIDMAVAYNGNPKADNRILKALNRDIEIDQDFEIRLLERLIDRYPGDPDAVVVDHSIIHGMPGHAGH